MGRGDTMSFLCFFFFFFSSALASSLSLDRQTDALDKLYFNPARLQRMAGFEDPSMAVSSIDVDKVIYGQEGLKEADKISALPGQPKGVDFDQYGGYVTIDELAGRALFYYFAEAAGGDSNNKPLLFWFNGGPGCSSLGFGAMQELGPFRVMSDGKTLFRNPYAWNKAANVLFLESPAGVGFSYSNTTSDYHKSGDRKTADDALIFILNWLERFPEYKHRDIFLAGESYAGHYVPQLAHTILVHNDAPYKRTIIHLKGFMIGNAAINEATDTKGMYDYFWTHALISDESILGINKYCNFSNDAVQSQARDCDRVMDDANVGKIDIYNIYAPLCTSNVTQTRKRYSMENFDPCSSEYVYNYLNNAEVQKALHANVTKLNYTWTTCSQVISWQDSPSTVLPLIQESMDNSIRVWVYSGDIDGRLPVTSTRYSLNELKLTVKSKWQPWYIKNEVAGYGVTYEGDFADLTFSTIRGAGHEVPSYQPERALVLVKSFIEGKLPSI